MNIKGFILNRLSDQKSQKQKTEEWAKNKLGRICRMKNYDELDSITVMLAATEKIKQLRERIDNSNKEN
jgi:hypothetical protein